eukprot:1723509-Rhodomonas_salina.1
MPLCHVRYLPNVSCYAFAMPCPVLRRWVGVPIPEALCPSLFLPYTHPRTRCLSTESGYPHR